MAYKIKIKFKGKDYWGRKVYENVKTKRIYKEVDGKLHSVTNEGEPLDPIKSNIKIIKVKKH